METGELVDVTPADFTMNVWNQPGGVNMLRRLKKHNGDLGCLRPWLWKGNSYITVQDANGKEKNLLTNAQATLTKDAWIELDEIMIAVAKERLKFMGYLSGLGLTYTVRGGLGKTVLQYQDVSDVTPATVSMEPMRLSERDRPVSDLKGMPLPVIHKDIQFGMREQLVSEQGQMPLETTTYELSVRRIMEKVEDLGLGNVPVVNYAGYTLYGARTFPSRITFTMTQPTAPGWTPDTFVDELMQMRQLLYNAKHFGPYTLFLGLAWDAYLDKDYSAAKGDNTLRERAQKIIPNIVTVDMLPNYEMLLFQTTRDVVRPVSVIPLTTIQWTEAGGMEDHWKIMISLLTQYRTDQNGNAGEVHAT